VPRETGSFKRSDQGWFCAGRFTGAPAADFADGPLQGWKRSDEAAVALTPRTFALSVPACFFVTVCALFPF
jgi:hypothetical protein